MEIYLVLMPGSPNCIGKGELGIMATVSLASWLTHPHLTIMEWSVGAGAMMSGKGSTSSLD